MRGWAVPGYTEVRVLGAGGFGEVVMARHDASGQLVAIKYLHRDRLAEDPVFAQMFRAEAAVLASLDDPHVVRLYDYLESPAGAAIVMELVDGVSLREIVARQGKTTAEAALVVLQGSLLGLAAAHAGGVVHRDYKPENVLVDGLGASKLTDFGIAARSGDRPVPAGTLAYAPPEQFGGAPATPASDVYAATVTFYECLAGHPPFIGDTREALMYQHLSVPVPLEPVPGPLRPLVTAGMAKDPGDRPADAARFVTELRAAAWPAYGRNWEDRGRSHLGETALLLAALWPSSPPPAVQGHAVQQVHLNPNPRQTPGSAQTRHLEHLRHLEHVEHLEHEHVEHLEHVEHVEHVERLGHFQHVEHPQNFQHVEQPQNFQHVEHLGQPHVAAGQQGTTGPGSAQGWTRRALRRGPLAKHPVAAVVAAVVGVAAIATVVATTGGSGPPSIAGTWAQNANTTWTFTSSGPDTYTVAEDYKNDARCDAPNDGKVTGSNRHYNGTVDLYPQSGGSPGQCRPPNGTAQITITLSANGSSAKISLVGSESCNDCVPQTWTRQS
jgi:serine/threonine protein kinase